MLVIVGVLTDNDQRIEWDTLLPLMEDLLQQENTLQSFNASVQPIFIDSDSFHLYLKGEQILVLQRWVNHVSVMVGHIVCGLSSISASHSRVLE